MVCSTSECTFLYSSSSPTNGTGRLPAIFSKTRHFNAVKSSKLGSFPESRAEAFFVELFLFALADIPFCRAVTASTSLSDSSTSPRRVDSFLVDPFLVDAVREGLGFTLGVCFFGVVVGLVTGPSNSSEDPKLIPFVCGSSLVDRVDLIEASPLEGVFCDFVVGVSLPTLRAEDLCATRRPLLGADLGSTLSASGSSSESNRILDEVFRSVPPTS